MRIDLILNSSKSYDFEGYASNRVVSALEELGVSYRQINIERDDFGNYIESFDKDSSDALLSFSSLNYHIALYCKLLQIPYFFWLEHSLRSGVEYLEAESIKLGVVDQKLCEKLNRSQVVHLPYGISENLCKSTKCLDVVSFSSLIDTQCLVSIWKQVLEPEKIRRVEKAIQEQDPLLAGNLYEYAEVYLQAQYSYQKIIACTGFQLDVFGKHMGSNWLQRLPNRECVRLHGELPFTEYLEVLKNSRVLLAEDSSRFHWQAVKVGCLPVDCADKALYYLKNPIEREKKLGEYLQQMPQQSWMDQTKKIIEWMS
ncbi:MAG: hypothetical protein S4CHLAM123_15360 [Chlamydiales bacterium]|nr:hypothetical protein [Chlamydiales bacterium]